MDISNQSSMPISLVKETPGSVLVKMGLKSTQPSIYYGRITLEPRSLFFVTGNESRKVLTLKPGGYYNIHFLFPGELTITLDFSVRQNVERMV